MRDFAIGASRLFFKLVPSGEALFPCGHFLGSTFAGEGEVAGPDERLWWFGVPRLSNPFASFFTTLIPILQSSGGCLGLLAFSFLPFVFVTLTFFM